MTNRKPEIAELHKLLDRFFEQHDLPHHGSLRIDIRLGKVDRIEVITSKKVGDLT